MVYTLGIVPKKHPCMEQEDYFEKKFSKNQNFESLNFDKGLAVGSYRNVSYVLKIRPQNLIESCIYLDGIWEPHVLELIAGYLTGSDGVVIDVGANVGATSIPLAKCFPETQFYLYEPHPSVFVDLSNNISFNKLENVRAYNFAVTNEPVSALPFYAQKNSDNPGLSSFKLNHDIEEYDVVQVKCTGLDSISIDNNKIVRIIKIDTQGHELEVLLSAKELINKYRPVILFEFESEYFDLEAEEGQCRESIVSFLELNNYEFFMNHPEHRFLPALSLTSYFHGDIVAVPRAVN